MSLAPGRKKGAVWRRPLRPLGLCVGPDAASCCQPSGCHGVTEGPSWSAGGRLRSFMGTSSPRCPDSVQDKHLLSFTCGLPASSQPHTPVAGELSGRKSHQRPFQEAGASSAGLGWDPSVRVSARPPGASASQTPLWVTRLRTRRPPAPAEGQLVSVSATVAQLACPAARQVAAGPRPAQSNCIEREGRAWPAGIVRSVSLPVLECPHLVSRCYPFWE